MKIDYLTTTTCQLNSRLFMHLVQILPCSRAQLLAQDLSDNSLIKAVVPREKETGGGGGGEETLVSAWSLSFRKENVHIVAYAPSV